MALCCLMNILVSLNVALMFLFGIFLSLVIFKIIIILKSFMVGNNGKNTVGFFHPYCNAGGGGERVLWTAVKAIQSRYPSVQCYIYTGDISSTPENIMTRVVERFNINIEKCPTFVYLYTRKCVEAQYYPYFTLLCQSLGSIILGFEAVVRFKPNIFIDTMGYAFTYPIFSFLGGCKVGCYTHYPTISSNMLGKVSGRITAHNNRSFIANSSVLSSFKMIYYYIFAFFYGLAGKCASVVMVNSSWTYDHISLIWGCRDRLYTVYPPCDTDFFSNLSLLKDSEKDIKTIISIGQFRPEKNHTLQLNAFKKLLSILDEEKAENVKLIFIGGVRDSDDEQRVKELQKLSKELNIDKKIEWLCNASYTELVLAIQKGTIGLHSMWNEHFGIGVVECMSGGLIMLAHNSGGPKSDIILPYDDKSTGFLAETVDDYAATMKAILDMSSSEREQIIAAARKRSEIFSISKFEEKFLLSTSRLFDSSSTACL